MPAGCLYTLAVWGFWLESSITRIMAYVWRDFQREMTKDCCKVVHMPSARSGAGHELLPWLQRLLSPELDVPVSSFHGGCAVLLSM